MRIDRTTPGLICVQIANSERNSVVQKLDQLLHSQKEITLEGEGDVRVVVRVTTAGIAVNASNLSNIFIDAAPEELAYLKESIEEHIKEKGQLPLDHALEPLGARFTPNSIKDLVIETVSD